MQKLSDYIETELGGNTSELARLLNVTPQAIQWRLKSGNQYVQDGKIYILSVDLKNPLSPQNNRR